jgi:2-methylcitrate dehydratase PrpD
MIVIAGLVFGAVLGAATAARRGGKRLDILQYAAGYGIAFCLLGVILTIFIERIVT